MRRGEALALRWSNFNPSAKTLRIERALEYTKKHGLQRQNVNRALDEVEERHAAERSRP